ncbi:hypothetical protein DL89DRAFT_282589 [Linderina pennispora]|uniref:FAD-binding FR-type domain-containing protein n=1 Tax=Linderina pennispora TaxID=61395 RepID=A0A1Y1WCD9_9FUNG|nr:uncharacterized protein DL89DRAFT_282589 [Linderina pennispora]ORX71102.1 hypothetical protein DL89DRAFT_282589 [Linderina pennispora]
MPITVPLNSTDYELFQPTDTLTIQSLPRCANSLPTSLALLDVSMASKPVTIKEGQNSASSNSEGNISESGTKAHRFQWRSLLDPEFYPEITVRRTVSFVIWTVPHIILTAYHGADKSSILAARMNNASIHCMLFDVACIMIFMSPTFLMLLQHTFLPRFIKFEKNIHAHKVAAYTMLFWSAVHIGIWYQRYIDETKPKVKLGKMAPGVPLYNPLFITKTGWTGHVLMFSLFFISIMSVRVIRKRQFELFYYVHHLFLVTFVFLFLHHDNHLAYKYIAGPLALYVLDRLYRNLRSIIGKSPIHAVVQHPSGVVEIQMEKKIIGFRPGQYVKVYCPSVSMLQWHPLTISSAPEEELLTIHFRLEGTWTRNLAKRLGCNFGNDARGSSMQSIVSKANRVKGIKFAKTERPRPTSQHLDVPYHPLHHDPTTAPMYSNAGGNSSYVGIDIVAKGGTKSIRNSMVLCADEKEVAKISMHKIDQINGNSVSASAKIEEGNMAIKMGREMPLLYIDGPYTGPMEHFFNYEVGVLIAAGIGVTPAASVLRSVYFQWIRDRYAMNTKKVYLFWVYRDIGTLEWFKDLLVALDEEGLSSIVQVRTYFTGKIPETRIPQLTPPDDKFGNQVINTSIGTSSYIGRPDFSEIFESIGELYPGQRIGTFFCGPKLMARKVRREAHKWDSILRKQSNTKIDFRNETFS